MKKYLIIITLILIIILASIGTYLILKKPTTNTSQSCIMSGESVQCPAALGKRLGECCEGLTEIGEWPVPIDGDYSCDDALGGGCSICAPCGNQKCELEYGENKCN